ncbi:hypothetical protein C0J52_11590 [Blattella germanica]|nr:hypothetical protein C0J52_11590 [Blattella germanica]
MVQYTGVSTTEVENVSPSAINQPGYHRAVLKNGVCNLYPSRVKQRSLRFLQDSVTTLVDMKWRYALLICTFIFFFSWTAFAVIWWIIAIVHGDFEKDNLPGGKNANQWKPCVTELYDFTSCFLFSMENQHTTGFGVRMPTEECPEAIILLCMQGIVGVILQSIMVGLVFLKMVRPKQRTRTLEFSNNAVICRRDGHLCLMFRVGDLRRSHIIEAKMRMLLVETRTTQEGEVVSPYRTELQVMKCFIIDVYSLDEFIHQFLSLKIINKFLIIKASTCCGISGLSAKHSLFHLDMYDTLQHHATIIRA